MAKAAKAKKRQPNAAFMKPVTPSPALAEIIVSKHRNGPVGKVNLAFMERYPKFANLWRDHGGEAPAAAGANGAG